MQVKVKSTFGGLKPIQQGGQMVATKVGQWRGCSAGRGGVPAVVATPMALVGQVRRDEGGWTEAWLPLECEDGDGQGNSNVLWWLILQHTMSRAGDIPPNLIS